MKSAGKARNNGLYRHIRTSKEIIRNLLNDSYLIYKEQRLGAVARIGPRELTCRQISHLSQATI